MIELEAVVEEVHEGFQSLDQQMSRAGQTATKIGDRLQVERKIFLCKLFPHKQPQLDCICNVNTC